MPKPIYRKGKAVWLNRLSDKDAERAMEASARLHPMSHSADCPVFQGASVSCVLPFVCCVPEDWQCSLDSLFPSAKNGAGKV